MADLEAVTSDRKQGALPVIALLLSAIATGASTLAYLSSVEANRIARSSSAAFIKIEYLTVSDLSAFNAVWSARDPSSVVTASVLSLAELGKRPWHIDSASATLAQRMASLAARDSSGGDLSGDGRIRLGDASWDRSKLSVEFL